MKVELIAITKVAGDFVYQNIGFDGYYTDLLAEFAGRTCYLSYDKPNPKTRSNQDYLANILKQGHESVLEHSSASFYVEGVSRNLLLELERHRFLSFSVVSTRYVDASKLGFVVPPAMRDRTDEDVIPLDGPILDAYNEEFFRLRAKGKTSKQAREAAAFILPGGLETRFVVTGNFRAWRDVFRKRDTDGANAEIRGFVQEALRILKFNSPNSFQDL